MQNFLTVGESKSARCDDLESLKKRKCNEAKIENPRGSVTVNKDKPVTDRNKENNKKLTPEQITQIQPQKLTLTLRSGKYSTLVATSVSPLPEQGKSVVAVFNSLFLFEICFENNKHSKSYHYIFIKKCCVETKLAQATNLNTKTW